MAIFWIKSRIFETWFIEILLITLLIMKYSSLIESTITGGFFSALAFSVMAILFLCEIWIWLMHTNVKLGIAHCRLLHTFRWIRIFRKLIKQWIIPIKVRFWCRHWFWCEIKPKFRHHSQYSMFRSRRWYQRFIRRSVAIYGANQWRRCKFWSLTRTRRPTSQTFGDETKTTR